MWPVIYLIPLIGWYYSIQTWLERLFQPMRALKFLIGHMVYYLAYDWILQLKAIIDKYNYQQAIGHG